MSQYQKCALNIKELHSWGDTKKIFHEKKYLRYIYVIEQQCSHCKKKSIKRIILNNFYLNPHLGTIQFSREMI